MPPDDAPPMDDAALLAALNQPHVDLSELVVTDVKVHDEEALIRRVNLLEILTEGHEDVHPPARGSRIELVRSFTRETLRLPHLTPRPPSILPRSEQDIRDYFTSGGTSRPFGKMHAPASPSSLRAKFPEPDEDAFRAWFPGLRRTSTEFVDPEANGKFIFISSVWAITLTSCLFNRQTEVQGNRLAKRG